MKKTLQIASFLLVAVLIVTGIVCADNFPEKEITIVSPFGAGGLNDVLSRAVATYSSEFLDKAVVVENVTGGGGVIGTQRVEMAKADGYSLVMASSSTIFTQYSDAVSNDISNLVPVIQICYTPPVLVVKDDAEWQDLNEFIAYAKENPGEVSCANSGTGGSTHLYAQMVEQRADIKLKHIPYDGYAPSMTAVLGGHIDASVVTPGVARQYIDSGDARVLAVASEERFEAFSEAPTFKEMGIDLVIEHWVGLMTTAGTPQDRIEILADAFENGMKKDSFKTLMEQRALELQIRRGDEFADFIENEDNTWRELILTD